MPLKIRHIRGPRKAGEQLTFATLSTREAKRISTQTIRNKFMPYYGQKADYGFLAEQVHDFSTQDSQERVIPILVSHRKRKNYPPETELAGQYLTLKRIGKAGKTIALVPAPVVHDIRYYPQDIRYYPGREGGGFDAVLNILEKGFTGGVEEQDNAVVKRGRNHRTNKWPSLLGWKKGITHGDDYSLEFFPEEGEKGSGTKDIPMSPYSVDWRKRDKIGGGEDEVKFAYGVHYASPKRILSVNIRLSPESSDKDKLAKMEFYKKQVADKYNVPVRFYENPGSIEKGRDGHEWMKDSNVGKRIFPKSLERTLGGTLAIMGLISSIFFFSSNVTGNVIGNLTNSTSNIIGAALFLIGIVGAFFYFRRKR